MKNIKKLVLGMIAAIAMVSCKFEDPLLDNNVTPVLVDIVGAAFGAPFSAKPSVSYPLNSQTLTLSARLLELDKTHILDHTKGIDSIPVSGVKITLTYRTQVRPSVYETGTIGEFTSDANGLVTVPTSWEKFLITKGTATTPAALISDLSWTGTHKGIAFTRLSQIQAK
jgi:hypothetical protein